MKKYLIFSLMMLLCLGLPTRAARAAFSDETLKYVVTYKWGLITKDSGDATLTLRNHGNHYNITLTGRTRSWADKFFSVRDTLHSTIRKDDLKPLSYTRIAHEGNKYAKDVLTYSHSGEQATATASRYRLKKGKEETAHDSFTATAPVYDMLSIFYYLRSIDYETLKNGDTFHVTMFSGSKKESMTVKNIGIGTVKMRNGVKREAYHISFRFTQKGGKKSSDDIEAWISTDSHHVPLLLEGSLAIGKIKCYLVSQS